MRSLREYKGYTIEKITNRDWFVWTPDGDAVYDDGDRVPMTLKSAKAVVDRDIENKEASKGYAQKILDNVNAAIKELEAAKKMRYNEFWDEYHHIGSRITEYGWSPSRRMFNIGAVCDELSIFDWWNDSLSMSQLKAMRSFLKTAIKLGFAGYVCFKVGAAGCSHGMWAHKNESTDGYSPDGDVLFHSFRSGDNYWDMSIDGEWLHDKYATEEDRCPDFTLDQIKAELA